MINIRMEEHKIYQIKLKKQREKYEKYYLLRLEEVNRIENEKKSWKLLNINELMRVKATEEDLIQKYKISEDKINIKELVFFLNMII